jgi:transcriptional regulator with XRE-family HTH domain
MNKQEFGEYIKKLRKDRNLTIRQVELYAGVSNSYLSLLENGKRDIPSPEILKKLATAYKVDYNDLMDKAGYLNIKSEEDTTNENENLPDWIKKLPPDLISFLQNEAKNKFTYLRVAQKAKLNDLPPRVLKAMVESFKRAYEEDVELENKK